MITQTPLPPADPTAVIGRRVLAFLIDLVIGLVLLVVLFASLASSEEQTTAFEAERICDVISENSTEYSCFAVDTTTILISSDDLGLISLIGLLYAFVTQMLLPAFTGFSPGKAIVGLRIVNQESFQRAGIVPNLVRWLLWIVDSAPWCFPLVGLITGLSSNGHRRVGDMAARTVVIDKKWVGHPLPISGINSVAAVTPPAPTGFGSTYGTPPPPPTATPSFGTPPPPPSATPSFGTPPPPPSAAPSYGTPPTTSSFPPAPPVTPPPPDTPSAPPFAPPVSPPPSEAADPPMFAPPIAPTTTPPAVETMSEAESTDPTAALDATTAFESEAPVDPPPPAAEAEIPTAAPPPQAPPAPTPAPRPGIDEPQWDAARDTYIQWDPELSEWMEWSESAGAWIPISR